MGNTAINSSLGTTVTGAIETLRTNSGGLKGTLVELGRIVNGSSGSSKNITVTGGLSQYIFLYYGCAGGNNQWGNGALYPPAIIPVEIFRHATSYSSTGTPSNATPYCNIIYVSNTSMQLNIPSNSGATNAWVYGIY